MMKVGKLTSWLTLLASALFMFHPAAAQQLLDPLIVYEPATENQVLPGARASGMGGAQVAAGDDGSVIWYNPALMTRIKSTEFSGTLTHQRFANNTAMSFGSVPEARVNNTSLGGLWAMFSVPVERGGLTLGLAVNRVRSFDRIFRYTTGIGPGMSNGGEDESGSLWAWSLGGAIELSPRSSLGLSLDILDGHDDYSYFYDSPYPSGFQEENNINDEYTGVSGKIGVAYAATNWLNLGAVIGLPASISIDQTSDYYSYSDSGSSEDHGAASYRYTLPFWVGAGAAATYRDFTFAGDISYVDYTQLEYWRGIQDISRANMTVKQYYNDVLNLHLGAEYTIRPADIRLRAGYYRQPIPFNGFPVEKQPNFFTFGAGFLIDKTVNLDLALLTGSWERRDPTIGSSENYNAQRFLATISYRIK